MIIVYKDKDKQRQAVRDATRRYRERKQGITRTTVNGDTVIPKQPVQVIPSKIIRMDSSLTFTGELTKTRQISRKGFNG